MEQAWIGLVGTIAGGLLVAIYTYFLKKWDRVAEDERAARDYFHSKLETLHSKMMEYVSACHKSAQDIIQLQASNDMKLKGEVFAANSVNLSRMLSEITSTQRIYLPSAKEKMKEINTLTTRFTWEQTGILTGESTVDALNQVALELGFACSDVCDLIEAKIRERGKLRMLETGDSIK